MPVSTRILKRRIKSITSTRKIMRAMELVASSKMRRAVQMTLGSRPYAALAAQLSEELRAHVRGVRHPLLAGQPGPTLLLVVASDRGLCGGFNQQIAKKALQFVREAPAGQVQAVAVGRRAEQALRRAEVPIVASFPSLSNAPSFEAATPVATYVVKEFLEGRVGRVVLAYTDFKGALTQVPNIAPLLPIDTVASVQEEEATMEEPSILFEPTPDAVLETLLPRMVDLAVYQALLESAASEHSARMMAMRSAKDAAGEMLDGLTFTLNQARQSAITREISEISAGKAAIE